MEFFQPVGPTFSIAILYVFTPQNQKQNANLSLSCCDLTDFSFTIRHSNFTQSNLARNFCLVVIWKIFLASLNVTWRAFFFSRCVLTEKIVLKIILKCKLAVCMLWLLAKVLVSFKKLEFSNDFNLKIAAEILRARWKSQSTTVPELDVLSQGHFYLLSRTQYFHESIYDIF